MADAATRHARQVEAWNGPMGAQWAANEARTERGLALVAGTPTWFLRTGSGNDAIAASTGQNVIDGGTGSNVLSGQGNDTFFLDARDLTAPV